ncbi:hypothetical protein SESBI_17119 [Sesbania bispinosa]|nr:hypothetical protein SESBI_17119 [Sesbania bispinosa]
MAKRAPKKATLTLSKATTSNAVPSSQRRSSTAGKSKGSWLARQFTKVGKAVSGHIAIGGLITPIARHFNISLDGDKPILGTSRIDFEMLVNNEMLVKRDDHYYLVMSDNLKMPPQSLPNPHYHEHSSGFSSIPMSPHANDFSRLHESIAALQAQQDRQYTEFVQFRDRQHNEFVQLREEQHLHQRNMEKLLQDTIDLFRTQLH